MGLALALGACGADPGSHAVDPAQVACDERSESATAISASPERDDSAPELELGGEPYTVTLPDAEAGYVRVEIAGDTFALLLVGAEEVVTGLYHEDEQEDLVSAGPDEFCPDEIPEHFDIDFHDAGRYYIQLGPSVLSEVWLLLLGGEGHGDASGHGEHDH